MKVDFQVVAAFFPTSKPFIWFSKYFIMEILILAIALVSVALIIRHNARVQAARDQMAARQTYEHIAVPILVVSEFPEDDSVHLRAQAWREKLRAAGNRYAETLPIVPYPFALGADQKCAALTTWRTYQINAGLKFAAMLAEWDAKIAAENPAMASAYIFNQRNAN